MEKKVWEKSIGSLSSNKKGLGILVRKAAKTNHDFKKPTVAAAKPAANSGGSLRTTTTGSKEKNSGTSSAGNIGGKSAGNIGGQPLAVAGGLGLLGAYSDSGSSSE